MAGPRKKPDFSAFLGEQIRQARATLGEDGLDSLALPAERNNTKPDSPNRQSDKTVHKDSLQRQFEQTDHEDSLTSHTDQTVQTDSLNDMSTQTVQVDSPNKQTVRTVEQVRPIRRSNKAVQIGSPVRQSKRTVEPDSKLGQSNQTVQETRTVHSDIPIGELDSSNNLSRLSDQAHHADSPIKQSNTVVNRLTGGTELRTPSQRIVAEYLARMGSHITSYALITEDTSVPYGTLRGILRRFSEQGFITTEKYFGEGNLQGLIVTIKSLPTIRQSNKTVQQDTAVRLSSRTVHTPPILEERKKDLSISQKQEQGKETGISSPSLGNPLTGLTREDINFFWPELGAVDFGPSQIRQILERLEQQGKEIDAVLVASLREGLTHADAALSMANGKLTDQRGTAVTDPRAYIFRALAKDAYYAAPKGYISPETQRMRDQATRKEEETKAFKRLQEAEKMAAEAEWLQGFDAMMEEGEANSLYCKLRNELPPLARRGEIEKSAGFISAIRSAYKKHTLVED